MKPRTVEYRNRSARAPAGGLRLLIGTARTATQAAELEELRKLCKRLAARGEWDVLLALKARTVTLQEVARLIDDYGWQDYRTHLELKPAAGVPTLDAHLKTWLSSIEKDNTRRVYRREIRRLADFRDNGTRLGDLPWHEIHPHHIQDHKSALTQLGLYANSIQTALGSLGSFFTWAVDREESEAAAQSRPMLRETSPVRRAKAWGRSETTRHRFLSPEEFSRLLETAPSFMRAQYATLALGGLRIDELMNIPPGHVHLPTHIHIGPWGDWAPKGYPRYTRGVRDVPVHRGTLLPLLEEYRDEWAGERAFFVNPTNGEPWGYKSFLRRFELDIKAAGMVYGQRKAGKRQPEGITPHTLRHTLASWLAQADVQLMKIAAILGDTEETVRRHYAHLLPADLDETVNRLSPSKSTASVPVIDQGHRETAGKARSGVA